MIRRLPRSAWLFLPVVFGLCLMFPTQARALFYALRFLG